jgi:hypothetical protein
LISFLSVDTTRKVAFFFCDFNTPVHAASTRILRALTAQILRLSPDAAPFIYEEYIAHGKKPTNDTLTELLPQLINNIGDLRIVVDGVDEISTSEHSKLIKDLLRMTKNAPGCNLLLISQDVPSISLHLLKHPRLSMTEEGANIKNDLAVVVNGSLKDLDIQHDGALGDTVLARLQSRILQKAEGRAFWQVLYRIIADWPSRDVSLGASSIRHSRQCGMSRGSLLPDRQSAIYPSRSLQQDFK